MKLKQLKDDNEDLQRKITKDQRQCLKEIKANNLTKLRKQIADNKNTEVVVSIEGLQQQINYLLS